MVVTELGKRTVVGMTTPRPSIRIISTGSYEHAGKPHAEWLEVHTKEQERYIALIEKQCTKVYDEYELHKTLSDKEWKTVKTRLLEAMRDHEVTSVQDAWRLLNTEVGANNQLVEDLQPSLIDGKLFGFIELPTFSILDSYADLHQVNRALNSYAGEAEITFDDEELSDFAFYFDTDLNVKVAGTIELLTIKQHLELLGLAQQYVEQLEGGLETGADLPVAAFVRNEMDVQVEVLRMLHKAGTSPELMQVCNQLAPGFAGTLGELVAYAKSTMVQS